MLSGAGLYTAGRHKKAHYDALEQANKDHEITGWLDYFARTLLEAQPQTQAHIEFLIAKARLYDRLRGQLNARHEKMLARMFWEGPHGFTGDLSAENYIRITQTSAATAPRDLQDLVQKGALTRVGERRYTRYHLNLAEHPDRTTH